MSDTYCEHGVLSNYQCPECLDDKRVARIATLERELEEARALGDGHRSWCIALDHAGRGMEPEEMGRLAARAEAAELERDEARGILASAMDKANVYARELSLGERDDYHTSHAVRDLFSTCVDLLRQRLHDERYKREAAEAQRDALREALGRRVEEAYREGWQCAFGEDNYFPDDAWNRSAARAALAAAGEEKA